MLDTLISKLGARIQELENFIGQSAGNHNQIIGRLEEAKEVVTLAESIMKDVAAPAVEVTDATQAG